MAPWQRHVTPPVLYAAVLGDKLTRHGSLATTYFDGTGVRRVGAGDEKPKDPNKAKLGKSM